KNTQLIKQIKIYAKEIPCLYLASPLAFKIVETNTSNIGYGSNLKQLVDNKEQLVQYTSRNWNNAQKNYVTVKKDILIIVSCIHKFQTPYNSFSDNNLIFVDLILTKDVNKLFLDCRKLYLPTLPLIIFDAIQIHYQILSPTKIEKTNLIHEFLRRNKALEKFLITTKIGLCANHSMHERKIFPKTFICKIIFPFVLQEMESIKDTLSPTETKKNMKETLEKHSN
ncbi:hypothetical protein CFOL_v3_19903, partial [Cephalotus follicularis]